MTSSALTEGALGVSLWNILGKIMQFAAFWCNKKQTHKIIIFTVTDYQWLVILSIQILKYFKTHFYPPKLLEILWQAAGIHQSTRKFCSASTHFGGLWAAVIGNASIYVILHLKY